MARTLNTEMVRADRMIGHEIVEGEQRGRARAGYGEGLPEKLSTGLQADLGKGCAPARHAPWGTDGLPVAGRRPRPRRAGHPAARLLVLPPALRIPHREGK